MKDYYNILGVDPHCPQADIKKAYRQLALQHHPDKNQGNKKSEEHFKLIAEAYVILNDAAARSEYDYKRGFKTSYRSKGTVSGKPTPVQYLLHIKAIKSRILTNGGHVKHDELYNSICSLLSEDNINHLLFEADITTNNLIIDEVLTCCIFLNEKHKKEAYQKLQQLATNYHGFKHKIAALEKIPEIPKNIVVHKKSEQSLPRITLFVFLLFILLFVFLFIYL